MRRHPIQVFTELVLYKISACLLYSCTYFLFTSCLGSGRLGPVEGISFLAYVAGSNFCWSNHSFLHNCKCSPIVVKLKLLLPQRKHKKCSSSIFFFAHFLTPILHICCEKVFSFIVYSFARISVLLVWLHLC